MSEQSSAPFPGTRWGPGLPSDVYEAWQTPAVAAEVRMDVAGFVGLTERGPVCRPVPLESWDGFLTVFGRPGGGRILPQAVFQFFANGGRRCVVVRAVDYCNARCTEWTLPGLTLADGRDVRMFARDPGRWGDRLRFQVALQALYPGALRVSSEGPADVLEAANLWESPAPLPPVPDRRNIKAVPTLAVGSLLEIRDGTGVPHRTFVVDEGRVLDHTFRSAADGDGAVAAWKLDRAVPLPLHDAERLTVRELRLRLEVHLDSVHEVFDQCALHPRHPRFLPRLVQGLPTTLDLQELPDPTPGHPLSELSDRCPPEELGAPPSRLLRPAADELDLPYWPDADFEAEPTRVLFNDPALLDEDVVDGDPVRRGLDAEDTTRRQHFYDEPWSLCWQVPAHIRDLDTGAGRYDFGHGPPALKALSQYDARNETQPISLVYLPDLLHLWRPPTEPVALPAGDMNPFLFGSCEDEPSPPPPLEVLEYPGLMERDDLLTYQHRLIDDCEALNDRVAVLDLPPELDPDEVRAWRRSRMSARAALYSPYLRVAPVEQPLAPLALVPPGGSVCGLIARRERESGVQSAPANMTVRELVALDEQAATLPADLLHEERVNAVRRTEQGFQLMGARTTSADPDWTQLSVRRLMDYLQRQLRIDTRFAVFEPNNEALWARIGQVVRRRLRTLYDRQAFAGRTPQQAYFVRCDGETNTQQALDAGQVITLVGVAPAAPAEFIVFQLVQLQDGGIESAQGR